MNEKQAAEKLFKRFFAITGNTKLGIKCALQCVTEIELELEDYAGVPVGFSYWKKVKKELNQIRKHYEVKVVTDTNRKY